DAGPDALEALGGLHYDAGRYRPAALAYARLLELRGSGLWAPETLFRAADSLHRAGDPIDANFAAKRLLDRIGDDGLPVSEGRLSREDVRTQLNKPVEASGEWSMFGGDPGRSSQGDGGMPFLFRQWETPTD